MSEIVCQVGNQAGQVEFIWSSHGGFFRPYVVSGQQLTELRRAAERSATGPATSQKPSCREALETLVFAVNQAGPGSPPWEPSYELAEAGFRLFNCLLPPEDDTARKVRGWLDNLRTQSELTSLEIVVEERSADLATFLSVPWNLVYDERPAKYKGAFQKGQGVERWRPFWSVRYNLTSGRRVEPLKRLPLWSDPRVIVVVDPTVHNGLNEDQKQRLDQFLAEAKLTAVGSMDELEAALEEGYPRLLYWLGHATPEYLQLGDERIAPGDLRNLLRSFEDRQRPEGMLAFLNACQTAETGSGGSFLDVLHSFGFTGAIATERQTIDNFANDFGLSFLRGFLREGKPLGELLHSLRLQSAPLGLLYGAHCPPEIRVQTGGGAAVVPVPLPIQETHLVAGIALGTATLPAVGRSAASVDRTSAARQPAVAPPVPEEPYRSLGYYDEADRALFTGRDADAVRFAATLDRPDTRILILHGESGIGKSSFLRAGVIPYLEEECVGYRFLRRSDGSLRIIQPAKDLLGMAAQHMLDATAQPVRYRTPEGGQETVNLRGLIDKAIGKPADFATLRQALRRDSGFFAEILSRVADRLPYALVVVFDQFEEVFTLSKTPAEVADRDHALQMLCRVVDLRADVKLIISLRTEYYGRLLDHLRAGRRDLTGVRDELLRDFSKSALIEAITRPTTEAKYRFHYAEGIAKKIAEGVLEMRSENQDSVLPLVQVVCTQLYARKKARPESGGVITGDDLEAIQGVEGGLKAFAEDALERSLHLDPEDRQAFKGLFSRLFNRQPDGTLTTWLMPRETLERQWDRPTPFADLLDAARSVRLLREDELRIEGGEPRRYIRLGHDALAKVAAIWKAELEENQRLEEEKKKRVEERLKRLRQRRRLVGATLFCLALAVLFGLLGLKARHEAEHALRAEERATRAADDAHRKSLEADQARRDADEKRRLAELRLYDSDMLAFQTAQNMNDCHPLEEILDAHLPDSTTGEDLRGFEWYLWDSLFRVRCRVIKGHGGAVLGVAFSGDGQRIASASSDKTVRVWDTATGRQLMNLEGHTGPVNSVAFHRDGRRIASASSDKTVRVWDSQTGRALVLERHTGPVNRAVFSSDGLRIASASDDTTVRVWDAGTGRQVLEITGHILPVNSVAFSGDGRRIASASDDMTARIWDASSGKEIHNLEQHTAPVRSVAFFLNDANLASTSDDKTILIWNALTGQRSGTLALPAGIGSLAFNRDSSRVVAGVQSVYQWNVLTNQQMFEMKGHSGPIRGLAFSDDGRLIASGSEDRTLRVWEATTGQQQLDVRRHTGPVRSVAFSGDGLRIASASDDRTVQIWDAASGRRLVKLEGHDDCVTGVAFRRDGRRIASASGDGTVRVWDIATRRAVLELKGPDEWLTSVAFSGDGRWIAAASYAAKVRLWDAETGRLERELKGHAGAVRAVAFSGDDRSLASASEDGTVRVWDVSSGQQTRLFEHTEPVIDVAFSEDSRRIASACADHTVRIWDASSDKPIWVMRGHTGRVHGVAFSGDGRRVVSASEDDSVRVWDTTTGQALLYLFGQGTGPGGAPCRVAFSDDGRRIALAGHFGIVRVWDTTTATPSPDFTSGASFSSGQVQAAIVPTLDVGDLVPEFTARLLGPGRFKLSDQRGKLVLLHFWSTGSSSDMPGLQDIHKTFKDDPRFELVCLSCDPAIEAPQRFASEKSLSETQAFIGSPSAGLATTYIAGVFPASYLIGPDGRILARGFDRAATERAVRDALGNDKLFADAKAAGRVPRFPVTRFHPGSPETAPSDAPAVVVLDNCDTEYMEARPHRDGLRFLSDSGRELRSIKEFNTADSSGAIHSVAADRARGRIYVAENSSDRVTALDLLGRKLWQVRKIKADALAVDPKTGHIWCSSGGGFEWGETVVLDVDGNEVDSFPFGGWDIVHDPHTGGFWLVSHQITKLSREGEVLFHKPLEGWDCVSVAVNPKDGSVWIAQRAISQIPQSVPRLWHLDARGHEIWSRVLTNKDPFAVACDPGTGSAFVVIPTSEVLHFAADGGELPPLPVAAVAVAVSPTTGQLWVTTQRAILQLDATGKTKSSSPFGKFSNQSRLVAF